MWKKVPLLCGGVVMLCEGITYIINITKENKTKKNSLLWLKYFK